MNQHLVLEETTNLDYYGHVKYPKLFRWARIFIFEFVSSILLIYGIMATQYQTPPYPRPDDYQPVPNPGHSLFQSLALFLVMSFAGQLTGGYSNPAIALALVISKGNKITPKIGLVYALANFLGSLAGGGLVYVLIFDFDCPNPQTTTLQFRAFAGQIIGTFLISLFVLIIVHEQTTIIKSILWSYILVPIVYFVARQATFQIDGLNPSVVLTEQFFVSIRQGYDFSYMDSYWAFFFGPFIGAAFGGIFFNIFYLPLFRRWKVFSSVYSNSSLQKG